MPILFLSTTAGDQFNTRLQEAINHLEANLGDILWNLVLLLVGYVLMQLTLRWVSRMTSVAMKKKNNHRGENQTRRMNTLITLLRSALRYGLYFLYLYFVLRVIGVDTGLLAAAGIGSFAIGFGAQSLVKDVINGFFMMFENQFSVGDFVKIDEIMGTVEATAMRVTYVRTYQGQQVIIPNGTISRVYNYSRGDAMALVTVCIPYHIPLNTVIPLVEETLVQYATEQPDRVTGAPFIRGVVAFGASGAELGMGIPVASMQIWSVEREVRLALKYALDQAGIPIGYPHMTLVEQEAIPTPPAPEPTEE